MPLLNKGYIMTKAMNNDYHDLRLLEMAEHRLMLEEFLVKKANLQVRDKESRNTLYWAIKNRSRHNTTLLLKYKIDLMVTDTLHAIFHAISSHDIETFIYLLDSNLVNLNIKNIIGESLLMRAIDVESVPMVRHLINHGADLYASNDDEAMAIDYAQHCKNRDVYNLVYYRILNEKSRKK